MTLLPPTLRTNWRYILARIEPAGTNPDQKALYLVVSEAVTSLYGDACSATIRPAVVYTGGGHVILRCARGSESALSAALATVSGCGGNPIALRTLATSGTIKKLKSKITSPPASVMTDIDEVVLMGKVFTIWSRSGKTVNLREKGFNKGELLFFTEEDLENLPGNPGA